MNQVNKNRAKAVCVNLGCGSVVPPNWINCDSSLNAQVARIPVIWELMRKIGLVSDANWSKGIRYLQLRRRFPWANNKVDVVYASHVLEHLDKKTTDNFLKEAYRVLKPGGVMRLVVPDLYYHAKKYVDNIASTESGAETFLSTIHLRQPEESNLLKKAYYLWMGYPHLHKDMYDKFTLEALVVRYGFMPIGYYSHGCSPNIENVNEVEFRTEEDGSIYLEATKDISGSA